eukprot:GHRR01032488.1.p1 GENE.GHRR01032488.1~~GHRR01032488.1.p1  ORF type:complete len:121 (+),score=15.81 GHRR01032488.1:187-549(+)
MPSVLSPVRLSAVFVVKVDPNYAQPWQKCPQRSSSGSAFVLDTDKRVIITNAHVVSQHSWVQMAWLSHGNSALKLSSASGCAVVLHTEKRIVIANPLHGERSRAVTICCSHSPLSKSLFG